ncbi:MAG: hypothetical protein HYR55_14980 [Acidobacteria bacterium]|nr:hypothetical protein [Acidobacteriota bacterium]MBI3657042.1 hypothetical protein [Acidobacteriota bacterium]
MWRTRTSLLVILILMQGGVSRSEGASPPPSSASEESLKKIEAQLCEALGRLEQTQAQLEALKLEVGRWRAELSQSRLAPAAPSEPAATSVPAPAASVSQEPRAPFAERIIGPGLGENERPHEINLRPEIFIQTRYSTRPYKGATLEDFPSNFRLSRIETRWSGRIHEQLGLGLELQYHPAPDGSPEELVNDAFIEYYLNDRITLRAGQFIKPFGFDIQQSSSVRESPERALFAGYFFPGQRDRGALLQGDLDFLDRPAFKNIQYFVGAFNGNRFFSDNNRQLNYNFRLRKRFESLRLATGVSIQRGHQRLPPGFAGTNNENVFGVDVQSTWGRWGFRGEFVAGNMPSTRLGLPARFAPAFRPGRHSSGGAFFATYHLTEQDNLYARYDQFNGDSVTGQNVRAFNFGYFRRIGDISRISIDYQFKNRLSFNDDGVNTRLQATWGVIFRSCSCPLVGNPDE